MKNTHTTARRLTLGTVAAVLTAPTVHAQAQIPIPQIQGAGHLSPHTGQTVTAEGVVTAVAFNGYYIQDLMGDGNPDTSDGLFVSAPASSPNVGDYLQITGMIVEAIGGGPATGNLSVTQMQSPVTVVLGTRPTPAPVVIGVSGRVPPTVDVISGDELPVNLQNVPGHFDPAHDGIDFYESLEGMLVKVEDPVAVSGVRTFNPFSSEVFTLVNNGTQIAPVDARTSRGGISLQPDPDNTGDQNPERVQIQFDGTLYPAAVPAIAVGDRLSDVTGVVGYSFGNFEVNAVQAITVTSGGLQPETTALVTPDGRRRPHDKLLTVVSYNVLNLSPDASVDPQRATLASHIVHNLGTPDIIALQEIQDNSGTLDDGVTDATQTLQALADAVVDAGGPRYRFFDVAPADGASGGAPGGNIRNAFLYNDQRVELLRFVSLTPSVLAAAGVAEPDAFVGTRDPLAARFKLVRNGEKIWVINNHLTSRFGSTPVFGGPQPFVQAGEAERGAQTRALNAYVDRLLRRNRRTHVVVLGDLNTMEFTDELTDNLPGTGRQRVLTNLIDTLADDAVYTFIFEGNSQVLDHAFVTRSLERRALFDIVHANVDFPRIDSSTGSDHDPLVLLLDLGRR